LKYLAFEARRRPAILSKTEGSAEAAERSKGEWKTMKRVVMGAVAAAALGAWGTAAQAEGLKIGFLATLSGPSAVLGEHMRDGFRLAVKQNEGKLGGLDTEVLVVDDELKPDAALTKVQGLLERDKVDMMAGIVFSNVMMAVYKPIMQSETIFVGGNAGPSPIA